MKASIVKVSDRHLNSDNIESVKRLIRRLGKELKIYNEIFYKNYYRKKIDDKKSIQVNLHFAATLLAKKHFQDKINYYKQVLLTRKTKLKTSINGN